MIERMIPSLPLQGRFWLDAKLNEDQEYELFLDWQKLSISRLDDLLLLIEQVITQDSAGAGQSLGLDTI